MKIEDIRNVGIAGHGSAGKTILAEAMLYCAGVINRMGRTTDGNTVSDFHNQEMERQISISTAMMHCPWMEHKINIIDAPGYQDFIGEMYGAFHVVDIGLITVDASSGIEVGTESAWRYARSHDLSKIFVVNKIDKDEIDFDSIAEELVSRVGPNAVVTQFPYKSGPDCHHIVDVIRGQMLAYEPDGSGKYTNVDIPEEVRDEYDTYRLTFMEAVIEHDEDLMNKYLEDEEISEDELKKALSHAVKHNEIYPIVCTSAINNVGVSRLMEILVKYGASAADLPDMHGKDAEGNGTLIKCQKDAPLAAQIFKTINEPHVGELSFVKVYSGALKVGTDVYNAVTQETERINTLYLLNGKERTETQMLETGDMGAIIKLKHSHTNDTLCEVGSPVIIDPIRFPKPEIREALVIPNQGDEDRAGVGLAALHQEDPTFHFHFDGETKETIVSAQGELQLDVIVTRLKNRYNVTVELAAPTIPYRETIRKPVTIHKRYKKQSGGRGQFGEVDLEIKPLHRGGGFQFINNITGGAIPAKFIPAVEKGVKQAMEEGTLVGAPTVDVSVRLFDGSFHNVDSSDMSFQIAGSQAFKEAVRDTNPIILEPIYNVEVRIPEEYMGTVMGDISSRRGKVLGMQAEGSTQIITAEVPLAELWKYSTQLRSMTQGRGLHSRSFGHYEPVSKDVQAKLVAAYQEKQEQH